MRKLDAYKTYLFEEFAASLFFTMMFTINLVYQVQIAHLNPLQLVLVGTVLEAAASERQPLDAVGTECQDDHVRDELDRDDRYRRDGRAAGRRPVGSDPLVRGISVRPL